MIPNAGSTTIGVGIGTVQAMRWFRRRRTPHHGSARGVEITDTAGGQSAVALEPAATDRVERALVAIAAHAAQLHHRLDRLERRVEDVEDVATAALDVDRLDHLEQRLAEVALQAPTHDDLLDVRLHSARLSAELVRVATELRAEIDRRAQPPPANGRHGGAIAGPPAERAAGTGATARNNRVIDTRFGRAQALAETIIDLSDAMDTLPADVLDRDRRRPWADTA